MNYSDILPDPKTIAPPRRIVLHWTGGGPRANSIDLKHYHAVFNQDGSVSKGVHSIAENMRSIGKGMAYAAHCGGLNSYSIGFSAAGMGSNKWPLTEVQVRTMLKWAAAACYLYDLDPRNPAHLHTHAEAWRLHKVKGTTNDTKWDIDVLHFLPKLDKHQVGNWLRETAGQYYDDFRREPTLKLSFPSS